MLTTEKARRQGCEGSEQIQNDNTNEGKSGTIQQNAGRVRLSSHANATARTQRLARRNTNAFKLRDPTCGLARQP